MPLDVCGVANPDVPAVRCDLPANHGYKIKELFAFGSWHDHLSRADNAYWIIPPNDERDEAIATSVSAAISESVDFIDILATALSANGYEIRRKPTGTPSPGAHASS